MANAASLNWGSLAMVSPTGRDTDIWAETDDGELVRGMLKPDGSLWFHAGDVWRLLNPPDFEQLLATIDKENLDEENFLGEGTVPIVSLAGLLTIIRRRLQRARCEAGDD